MVNFGFRLYNSAWVEIKQKIAQGEVGDMISVTIPGWKKLELECLVLDYNGTLARDGYLLPGLDQALVKLAENLEIHVLTADTFGLAAQGLEALPIKLRVLSASGQAAAKAAFVKKLGAERCCAVGNGLNDSLMVKECALGLVVIGPEGASPKTVSSADVVCSDIVSALSLLLNPLRLVATLRD